MSKTKIILIMQDKKAGHSILGNIRSFCWQMEGLKVKGYLKTSVKDARQVFKRKVSRPDIVVLDKTITPKPGKLVEEIVKKAGNPNIFYALRDFGGKINVVKTSQVVCDALGDVQRLKKVH